MTEARMPDGTVLRFPDGTPDDVIDRAVQEHVRGSQPLSRGERFATGAGDMEQGLRQLVSRAQARNPDRPSMGDALGGGRLARAMDGPRLPPPAEVDAAVQQREAEYQGRRAASGAEGVDWWRVGGQAAASLPLALTTPTGAGLGGAVLSGALQGAALGGLQPVTDASQPFSDQKARQVLYGGATGAAGGAAGNIVGRLLSPRVSPNVRALDEAGVSMTPGQMIGGAAQRIEDRLSSLPVAGDVIRTAQRRGVESLNRATANRVLREIGEELPDNVPVGREMVQHVAERVGRAYDDAIAQVRTFAPDQEFARDMVAAAQQFATPEKRAAFADFLQQNVASRIQGGQLTGETYKQIDSVLGTLSRSARSTTNLADREVGQMAEAVQTALRSLAARTNPEAAPAIRAADAAHAASIRLHAASAGAGARDGVFSGPQLSAAVRATDPSLRHNAFARGNALLQDLSDPAASVLPSTVPNSGTPERLMLAAALGGAGNAAGFVSLPALALSAGAASAYTAPARQALQAILTRDPSLAARLSGDALAQSGGALTAPLAAALLAPSAPQRLEQRR